MCRLLQLDHRSPAGFDRTRNTEIGNKHFDLTYLEESYTTEHWLVRIYKVLEPKNRVMSGANIGKKSVQHTYSKKVD